ncbi:MAG: hypothetical protein LBG59_02430 [Candidatus Peribacteria bacterium]|jgi:hypothetical protein|nr:hypothetical protein [Candidatus Peribacteria bacterium]
MYTDGTLSFTRCMMDIKNIRIEVKEYNDFVHPYFLATSPDVDGFMVEGHTMEEVFELVPIVLNDLLAERKKRLEKEAKLTKLVYHNKITVQFDIKKSFNLALV